MKEYIFLIETSEKFFNITYTREDSTTLEQMITNINKLIIDDYHTTEFIIKGVFKL